MAISLLEAEDIRFANIHKLYLRENGTKPADALELAFKRGIEPHGLMNRNKFTADERAEVTTAGVALPANGRRYKQAG